MDVNYQGVVLIINNNTINNLINCATTARNHAYVPYSHFKVGCAILTENDEIFTGCNVENVSYGATICAERTAAVKAVSEGHTNFKAVAIVGSDSPLSPCGICRQFFVEFVLDKTIFILASKDGKKYTVTTFNELFPKSFTEFKGDNI